MKPENATYRGKELKEMGREELYELVNKLMDKLAESLKSNLNK